MGGRDMYLKPVGATLVLRDKVYEALRSAIASMDIYADDADTKLDERRLAEDLGVSRTPIREALSRLEQEGLVRLIPRRGAFVVRKNKREILEVVCVWGALEGLAARLAAVRASGEEISSLRRGFVDLDDSSCSTAATDEYSDENIRFHLAIIRLSKCDLLSAIADGLSFHLQAIRPRLLEERGSVFESVVDHLPIVEALEKRDAELAERLVREHTDRLAENVNACGRGVE
jgi:DNA-binding GntR family transcriptional regulator